MSEFTDEQITCGILGYRMMRAIADAPSWKLGALDASFEQAFQDGEEFTVEDLADARALVLDFLTEAVENAGVRERVVRELEGRL